MISIEFSDVEIGEIPDLPSYVKPAWDLIYPYYKKEATSLAPMIANKAVNYTHKAIYSALGLSKQAAVQVVTQETKETPEWVNQLVDPMLGPTIQGVKQEIKKIAVPVILVSVASLLALLGGSFALGRLSKS